MTVGDLLHIVTVALVGILAFLAWREAAEARREIEDAAFTLSEQMQAFEDSQPTIDEFVIALTEGLRLERLDNQALWQGDRPPYTWQPVKYHVASPRIEGGERGRFVDDVGEDGEPTRRFVPDPPRRGIWHDDPADKAERVAQRAREIVRDAETREMRRLSEEIELSLRQSNYEIGADKAAPQGDETVASLLDLSKEESRAYHERRKRAMEGEWVFSSPPDEPSLDEARQHARETAERMQAELHEVRDELKAALPEEDDRRVVEALNRGSELVPDEEAIKGIWAHVHRDKGQDENAGT